MRARTFDPDARTLWAEVKTQVIRLESERFPGRSVGHWAACKSLGAMREENLNSAGFEG